MYVTTSPSSLSTAPTKTQKSMVNVHPKNKGNPFGSQPISDTSAECTSAEQAYAFIHATLCCPLNSPTIPHTRLHNQPIAQ